MDCKCTSDFDGNCLIKERPRFHKFLGVSRLAAVQGVVPLVVLAGLVRKDGPPPHVVERRVDSPKSEERLPAIAV